VNRGSQHCSRREAWAGSDNPGRVAKLGDKRIAPSSMRLTQCTPGVAGITPPLRQTASDLHGVAGKLIWLRPPEFGVERSTLLRLWPVDAVHAIGTTIAPSRINIPIRQPSVTGDRDLAREYFCPKCVIKMESNPCSSSYLSPQLQFTVRAEACRYRCSHGVPKWRNRREEAPHR